MTKVNYPRTSPYAHTPQSSRFIGRYQHRPIAPHAEDKPYTLKPEHHNKPERLSQELYGTPAYWWVFMARNLKVIRDPIWDFKTGTTIIVPSAKHIKSILG